MLFRVIVAVLLVAIVAEATVDMWRKRSIGVNDPITSAAVNVALQNLNAAIAADGRTAELSVINSVSVQVSLTGLAIDVNCDVLVTEADGEESSSNCDVKVTAAWDGEISSVEHVSCDGVLVDVDVGVSG